MTRPRGGLLHQAAAVPLLALAAASVPGVTAMNIARCEFNTSIVTNALSEDGFAEAVVNIGQFVCGGGSADETINTSVRTIASAVAEVVSEVEYDCTLEGDSTATAAVTSLGESRAEAVGTAISRVIVDVSVCMSCMGAARSVVNVTSMLAAEATLDNLFTLNLASTSGVPIEERRRNVQREVEEDVEMVLASVTGRIRANQDLCEAEIEPITVVGDEMAECNFILNSGVSRISEDAVAELSAVVRAFVCEDGAAEDMFDSVLTSTATALIDAVSQIDAFCETRGVQAAACAEGDTSIEAVARAQAEAFASAVVEAGTCSCNETTSISTSTIQEVFVQAASEATAAACSTGTGSSFMTDFERDLEEQRATAVARVIATASAEALDDGGSSCSTPVFICSAVCAGDNVRCRGEGIEPAGETLPCCNDAYHCVRRSSAESRCLRRDAMIPPFFDGRVDSPTICDP